jgi:cyclopropane-fatty-acyl-phospholipid synthase
MQPLLDKLSILVPHAEFRSYDGSRAGPGNAKVTVLVNHPRALLRILSAPRGLGLARAWVMGELDIVGDFSQLTKQEQILFKPKLVLDVLVAALLMAPKLGLSELAAARHPTDIEYRGLRPGSHSISQDTKAAEFHYGLSSDFYRLLLGPSMTYSCAVFGADGADSLDRAQARKHDIIARKLGLVEGATLLDVGCGWGSLLEHMSRKYGVRGIGITASAAQWRFAKTGTGDVEILPGDYRDILPRTATAAVSVGMYEHVGEKHSPYFFELIRRSLPAGSRYLNQAIVRKEAHRRKFRTNGFVQRYIFPNAQLLPLSRQLRDLDLAGFRVLSVETFANDYVRTLRCWLNNLMASWGECTDLVGEPRVRAWRIYLEGALARFEQGDIDVAQVLAEVQK